MVLTRTDPRHTDVMGFRREAEGATSLSGLATAFSRAVLPFGFTSHAIGHLAGGGRPVTMFMTTWPAAWMEYYAMHALIRDDPIVLGAIAGAEPFTWAEAGVGQRVRDNRVLAAARAFGFQDGFAVPIHGPGDARGVVALLGKRLAMGDAQRLNVIEMSRFCYTVARRLHARQTGPVSIPPREREALSLVARGFDDAAIGAALGITRTSAHVYVERVKRRLGATTRAHAVAIAMAEKLL